MDTNSQNINKACQGANKEGKFENDKSSLEKFDCTYRFEIIDSPIKMEMVDNNEHLGNEYSHSRNTDKSHQSIATGLQNMSQQIKCKEERLENDKSGFEIAKQIHCFRNTNSNSQSCEILHKDLDTEVKNIKKEVEVKKERLGSLHSYIKNSTDKILIFENTDSSFQDGKHGKFIDMIKIKPELKDPQYQISELENKNDAQDVKYDPSCEDTVLRTEKSYSEAGNSNLQNSDIGSENRFIKIECSDLKTENGYIGSLHSSGDTMLTDLDVVPPLGTMLTDSDVVPPLGTMLTDLDVVPPLGTMLTDSDAVLCVDTILTHSDVIPSVDTTTHFQAHDDVCTLLTPSEVTVNCHMGAVLTPSESHSTHMTTHSSVQPNQCNVCEKRCRTLAGLRAHIITHSTERPQQCNLCNKRFKTLEVLKRHMIIHSTERPHKCNMCDKGFKTLSNLRKHIVSHSTERPHQCNMCDKGFKSETSLRSHMISHSTERPHQCRVCDKRFKTLYVFRKHVPSHSRVRPYKCNVCDKRFPAMYNLKSHMRTHQIESRNLSFFQNACD